MTVEPREVRLGKLPCSSRTEVDFTFRNPTAQEIVVVGASTSCSCVAPTSFPLRIAPRSTAQAKLVVKTGAEPCRGARIEIEFFTDMTATSLQAAIEFDGSAAKPAGQSPGSPISGAARRE